MFVSIHKENSSYLCTRNKKDINQRDKKAESLSQKLK